VFNLQLRGHIQRWCGAGISSSPTLCSRPYRLLVLIKVVLFYKAVNKKPLHLRGLAALLFPSSCGIFRRNWHPSCNIAGGLSGFIGPFPSTPLDESRYCCVC